jgi:hypothetical protein
MHKEQKIMYTNARDGKDQFTELQGDDTVKLKEKLGPMDSMMLILSRQVDPRYKMEKETAFLEALVACRFDEANDILQSSGFSIDPNCVHKRRVSGRIAVTECPCEYAHPALTVAIQAGLENAVECLRCTPTKISNYMSKEKELCEIVELLIQRGADVNATGEETQDCESAGAPTVHDKTPLCAAVQRGSPTLVKILLDARANPDHTHRYDSSAWGPDRRNPFGPGVLKPESWLSDVSNGSVSSRDRKDPRHQYSEEIQKLLRSASQREADGS